MSYLKRVLITGANSYVGTNVEKWLMREPEKYYVETLDMKDPNWKNFDFSKFDVVFHVAGIAHVSTKKSLKDLYFKVNRDLTIETANKSKESGVNQFIFMSSMIVYSSKETKITLETTPNPDNFYGLSKLQAEEKILSLQTKNFNVCILRPPMIYGPNSKGNLPKLAKISQKINIIPKLSNKKSVLFINNLCKYVEKIILEESIGLIYPHDDNYFSTIDFILKVKDEFKKKYIQTSIFNIPLKLAINYSKYFKKIFGDYYYEIDDLRIFKEKIDKEQFGLDLTLRSIYENLHS